MSILKAFSIEIPDDNQTLMQLLKPKIKGHTNQDNQLKQNSFPSLIQQLIKKFRISLSQVLKRCPNKYAQKCEQNYSILIHTLKHYFHFEITHDEIYKNSIEMKQNLIKRIRQKDLQKKQLQRQVESTILTLRKNILKKDAQINKWKESAESLQKKLNDPQKEWKAQKKQFDYKNTISFQKSQIKELQKKIETLEQQSVEQQNQNHEETLERFLLVQALHLQDIFYSKK